MDRDREPAKPRRGRPPGKRPKVPHRARPDHEASFPLHVTMRTAGNVPCLRNESLFAGLVKAFRTTRRVGFRVVEYSVQSTHLHLIVEAANKDALTRGMKSFTVRANRLVNAGWGRMRGRIWGDRYHSRPLKTPRQVRNALVYCLHNFKKHQRRRRDPDGEIDRFSSGFWFEGWSEIPPRCRGPDPGEEARPTPRPRTDLLRFAWRRFGLIRPTEAPVMPE